jgi:hypothetical protein
MLNYIVKTAAIQFTNAPFWNHNLMYFIPSAIIGLPKIYDINLKCGTCKKILSCMKNKCFLFTGDIEAEYCYISSTCTDLVGHSVQIGLCSDDSEGNNCPSGMCAVMSSGTGLCSDSLKCTDGFHLNVACSGGQWTYCYWALLSNRIQQVAVKTVLWKVEFRTFISVLGIFLGAVAAAAPRPLTTIWKLFMGLVFHRTRLLWRSNQNSKGNATLLWYPWEWGFYSQVCLNVISL